MGVGEGAGVGGDKTGTRTEVGLDVAVGSWEVEPSSREPGGGHEVCIGGLFMIVKEGIGGGREGKVLDEAAACRQEGPVSRLLTEHQQFSFKLLRFTQRLSDLP